jgi:hypothetical protein
MQADEAHDKRASVDYPGQSLSLENRTSLASPDPKVQGASSLAHKNSQENELAFYPSNGNGILDETRDFRHVGEGRRAHARLAGGGQIKVPDRHRAPRPTYR